MEGAYYRKTEEGFDILEEFPDKPKTGDIYIYNDYEYAYNQIYEGVNWDETGPYFIWRNTNECKNVAPTGWGVKAVYVDRNPNEILSSIMGEPVTNMCMTFTGSEMTKPPIIPDSIISIVDAFWNCSNMEEAPVLHSGIKYAAGAFHGCNSLCKFKGQIKENDFSNYFIPEGIRNLSGMFSFCEKIEYMPKIPKSTINIECICSNCEKLQEVPLLPDGLINMNGAFSDCYEIKATGKLPDSVTDAVFAFGNCRSLTTVNNFPKNLKLAGGFIQNCALVKKVPKLPKDIKSINSMFQDCKNLETDIVIPNSVTGELFYTFKNCKKIKNIYVPNTVNKINDTFYKCTNAKSITIANENVKFEGNPFRGFRGVVICRKNSTTEEYCKKRNINYTTKNTIIPMSELGFLVLEMRGIEK